MERKNAWLTYSEKQAEALEALSASYKAFLDHGKTERECVREAVAMAKEAGYVSLREAIRAGKALKPGDKLYDTQMQKALLLFHIGGKPLEEGLNIVGAHIDSPRIDVKQNPLYENASSASPASNCRTARCWTW